MTFFLSPKLIFDRHLQREPFLFAGYIISLSFRSLKKLAPKGWSCGLVLYKITYNQTDDGLVECCGQKDCDEKACGSYTSVTRDDGSVTTCCGQKDCEDKFKASLPLYFGSSTIGNGGATKSISLAYVKEHELLKSVTVHCFLGNVRGDILVNNNVVFSEVFSFGGMVKEVNYNIPINNTNNTSTISIKGNQPYPTYMGLWGFGDNAWTGEKCELKLHFK